MAAEHGSSTKPLLAVPGTISCPQTPEHHESSPTAVHEKLLFPGSLRTWHQNSSHHTGHYTPVAIWTFHKGTEYRQRCEITVVKEEINTGFGFKKKKNPENKYWPSSQIQFHTATKITKQGKHRDRSKSGCQSDQGFLWQEAVILYIVPAPKSIFFQ